MPRLGVVTVAEPMNQDDENYKYKGLPLTPAVAKYIVASRLAGQTITKLEIVNYVEKFHAKEGGIPCQAADFSRTVKKALENLKASGGAENRSTGWWSISSGTGCDESIQSPDEGEVLGENVNEETQGLQSLLSLGEGEESIYLFYYPAYKTAALSSGTDKWLCKVGRTDSSAGLRILGQSTGMPERPEIGLVYRTNDSRSLESVLHGILTLRNQGSERSPGVEWFITSIEDVLSIIQFVLGTPAIAEPHA